MKRTVNGDRKPVKFGGVEHPAAGVVTRAGVTEVALFATVNQLRREREGTIDGVPHRITKVVESTHVRGMVVLTVEPVERSGDPA